MLSDIFVVHDGILNKSPEQSINKMLTKINKSVAFAELLTSNLQQARWFCFF